MKPLPQQCLSSPIASRSFLTPLCFPFLTLVVVVANMRENSKNTALCYYLLHDWNLVLVHKLHDGGKKSVDSGGKSGENFPVWCGCWWPSFGHNWFVSLATKHEWSTLTMGPTACWVCYRLLVDWLHMGTLLSPGSLRVTVCFSSYVLLQQDTKLWPWLQNFQTDVCFLNIYVLQVLITPPLTDIPGFSCYQPNSLEDNKNKNQCQLQSFFTSYEGEPRNLVPNQASTLLLQNFSWKGASILHRGSTWPWTSSFTS